MSNSSSQIGSSTAVSSINANSTSSTDSKQKTSALSAPNSLSSTEVCVSTTNSLPPSALLRSSSPLLASRSPSLEDDEDDEEFEHSWSLHDTDSKPKASALSAPNMLRAEGTTIHIPFSSIPPLASPLTPSLILPSLMRESSSLGSTDNLSKFIQEIESSKELLAQGLVANNIKDKSVLKWLETFPGVLQESLNKLRSNSVPQNEIIAECDRIIALFQARINLIASEGADFLDKRVALDLLGNIINIYLTLKGKYTSISAVTITQHAPWESERLRLEQQQLNANVAIKKDFITTLEEIRGYAEEQCSIPSKCSISYAWADEKERWVQPFLMQLKTDLQIAGIAADLDIKANLGGNIYDYIGESKDASQIVIVGTEALLCKYQQGLKTICNELILAKAQRAQKGNGTFAMLLSGDFHNTLPQYFTAYYAPADWRTKSYQANLKVLLQQLYQINVDDANYQKLWQSFEERYAFLTRPYSQEAVEKILIDEAKKQQAERKNDTINAQQTYSYSIRGANNNIVIYQGGDQKNDKLGLESWNLPFANDEWFIGRDKEVKQLNEIMAKPTTQPIIISIISGLGGIGKTQLATYYLYHSRQQYSVRLWFHADNESILYGDYLRLCQAQKLIAVQDDQKLNRAEVIAAVNRYLQMHDGKYLAVYDNAGAYSEIREFLPKNGGHVIITTRRQEYHDLGSKIKLSVFSEAEALQYLQKAIKHDAKELEAETPDLKILATKLGCLPLALAQAGAYINRCRKSIQEYLNLYDKNARQMLANRTLPTYSEGVQAVATTWNLSLQAIAADEAKAQESKISSTVLCAMSYLHPNNIPRSLLETWLEEQKLASASESEMLLDSAIAHLLDYSMIQVDTSAKTLSVHCLVQEIMRLPVGNAKLESKDLKDQLRDLGAIDYLNSLAHSIEIECTGKTHGQEGASKQTALLWHMLALAEHYEQCDKNFLSSSQEFAFLLNNIGKVLLNNLLNESDSQHASERALRIMRNFAGYATLDPSVQVMIKNISARYQREAVPSIAVNTAAKDTKCGSSTSSTSTATVSETITGKSVSMENLSQCLDTIKQNKDLLDRELKDQVMHEQIVIGCIETVSKQVQLSITTLQRYLEKFYLQDTQLSIVAEYQRMRQLIEKEITSITNVGGDALDKRHALTLLNIIQRSYAILYTGIDAKATQNEFVARPTWESQRLFLQQQQILHDQKVVDDFKDTLEKIGAYAQDNGTTPGNCYFSYVRPDTKAQEDNSEYWVQDFLVQLRMDLRTAGIVMNIDIKDNKVGNIHTYMATFKEASFIIPVGTPSLLRKQQSGIGAICTELVICNRKRAESPKSILPIVLVGDISSSFPPHFGDYYTAIDLWYQHSYQANLKKLIQKLYNIEVDDKEYQKLWQPFETQYPEFTKPLTQEVTLQVLDAEQKQQQLQQEKYAEAALRLFAEIASNSSHSSTSSTSVTSSSGYGFFTTPGLTSATTQSDTSAIATCTNASATTTGAAVATASINEVTVSKLNISSSSSI